MSPVYIIAEFSEYRLALLVKNPVLIRWFIALLALFSGCWIIVLVAGLIHASLPGLPIATVLTVAQYLSLVVFLYVISFFTIAHPQLFSRIEVREKSGIG